MLGRVLDTLGPAHIVEALATAAAVRALRLDAVLGSRLVIRTPDEMAGLTGFNFHRGVLAAVRRPAIPDPRALLAQVVGDVGADEVDAPAVRNARLVVVAEHIVDVDNVGSCFRNALAFGASAVLLDDRCPDPLYRKAVRTSLGAVLDVPWTSAPMGGILDALAEAKVHAIGLTPNGGPTALPAAAATRALATVRGEVPGGTIALVVGNEGAGLSAETLARCSSLACIPMAPGADSLNVATALAVALYEYRR